jgi:hypothetical protein
MHARPAQSAAVPQGEPSAPGFVEQVWSGEVGVPVQYGAPPQHSLPLEHPAPALLQILLQLPL